MSTLRIYSQLLLSITQSCVNYIIMSNITSLVLIYLITGSLCLLITSIQLPYPLPPPLVTTNLISFSMSLFVWLVSFEV